MKKKCMAVGGTAKKPASMEEQLAGPGGMAAPLHQIPALLPGQSTFLNGQLRLPISAILISSGTSGPA